MIAIAAMTPSRVIGRDGTIPWHYSEDLKFFKRTTLGHIVLMGRTTFDSLGRPLPGRDNWVLSRGPQIEGTLTLPSPNDIPAPPPGKTIFVIGGAQVYSQLLPRCREIFLTRISQDFEGDTFFPAFEEEFALDGVMFETPDFRVERHLRIF
jgi:dihydrofolate reductase